MDNIFEKIKFAMQTLIKIMWKRSSKILMEAFVQDLSSAGAPEIDR